MKNPNVTDKQRQARKEIYEMLTKNMTKEEIEEIEKEAENLKKEMGWNIKTEED